MYPDYISAINRLDYNVGRLVQKLKDLGIYDDTVIIYSSDHGSHFKTRNWSTSAPATTAPPTPR